LGTGIRQIYLFWDEYGYAGIADSAELERADYFCAKAYPWNKK